MSRRYKKRNFSEKLYKLNRVPAASNVPIDLVNVVYQKLADPPLEDQEKGSL